MLLEFVQCIIGCVCVRALKSKLNEMCGRLKCAHKHKHTNQLKLFEEKIEQMYMYECSTKKKFDIKSFIQLSNMKLRIT